MGKQELLLGGWEGDDDVLSAGVAKKLTAPKRLELKRESLKARSHNALLDGS